MLQAAVALAAVIGSTPPAVALDAPVLAPPHRTCGANIDPSFVRYAPPPTRRDGGDPLLWLIAFDAPHEADAGDVQAGYPLAFNPAPGCARLLRTRDGR